MKTNPHPHIRQYTRIQSIKGNAHLDSCFLPVRCGNYGNHPGRNLPIGIGIQIGGYWLLGPNPLDVGLVYIDLYLQRFHVDDGTDSRAREAAAGGYGRNHFARLRVLRYHDPGEWGPNDGVVQLVLRHLDAASRDRHVLATGGETCPQRLGICRRCVKIGLAGQLSLQQLSGARQIELGLGNLRPGLVQCRLRSA